MASAESSVINAPSTQSTYHLQSPQVCHSNSFFIDCHSTLIMWLIKTNCCRPYTYTRPPWATWWMRQLISRTRPTVHVLYSSSLPSTQALDAHIYCISPILPSRETSVLFAFFSLLNLIFRVNWELVILAFFFQGWVLKHKTSICYLYFGIACLNELFSFFLTKSKRSKRSNHQAVKFFLFFLLSLLKHH